jgi:TonB-dependent starch-binding outer membrane protein SusC
MTRIIKTIGLCMLLLPALGFLNKLHAQEKQVTGTVTSSENKQPLAGVTVTVKGSRTGTATDNEGHYKLTIPANATALIFSSTGFATHEVVIGTQTSINAELIVEVKTQDEVVVIGYQTVKRKDLLASVSSLSSKDLKDIPINSAAEALNGRLAGVTATTSEGSPDATVRIRVRGGMSITGDNSPLFIVDGIQVENALNVISPQDIQSIDVLKDAAATAIYGARGANGVIVITTRSGKPGRLIVNYDGRVGIKKLAKTLDVLSPYDYVFYQSERSRGSNTDSLSFVKNFGTTWDTLENYKNVDPVNWQDEVMGNTGITTTQSITALGGSKKMTYLFGYTYNNDKAIVINSNYKRHLLNLKGDYNITKNIKVGVSGRYTLQNVEGAGVSDTKGSSYNRLRNAVKYRPFLSSGYEIDDNDPIADPNAANGLSLYNPIALANSEFRRKTTGAFNVTAYVSYNIIKNLSFKSTFGYDWNQVTDRQFSDSTTPYATIQGGKKPIAGLDTTTKKTITNSNVLTYSVKGWKNRHDFDIILGEETYDLRTTTQSSLFKNYPLNTSPDDAFKQTDLGTPFTGYPKLRKTRYTNLSFFGRVNYSFLRKYYFSFDLRADGASKFAPGQQWGYFPAGSVAWKIKNEKFMQNVGFISDLKIRAGFGTVGNNRINDYLYLATFSNDGRYYYAINNQAVNGYYPVSLVNPDLKWESTIDRNLGVDISLLNNRVSLSVDVYNNSSNDLLLDVPIATTYGYLSQLQNIGKTSNKGVEIQLNAVILRKANNLSWTANFNISKNKNKVVALGKNQKFFLPDPSWGISQQPADYIVRIGDPVGSMWGLVSAGFYTTDDFNYNTTTGAYTLKPGVPALSSTTNGGPIQPGSLKFVDLNNDGAIDFDNDRTIIGDPTPDFTGGLFQQFTYKNWDASLFVNFSVGNDIYNANKIELTNGATANSNMLAIMADRWKVVTPTGQTAQWVNTTTNTVFGIPPDQLSALNANATIWQPARGTGAAGFFPSSWAIEDGSFLRINNLTIGYSLPVKSLAGIKMTKLRFYLTGNNLAILTNYSGYDPEVSVKDSPLTPGLDYSAYPKSRSFIFGVNATF